MRTRRAVVKVFFFWIALETIDFPIISTTTAVGRTGSAVMNESCETRLVAPIFFGSRSISNNTAISVGSTGSTVMNETCETRRVARI